MMFCVRLYQLCLSPFLGAHCRFYPSCSQYTLEALSEQGFLRGSYLSIKRLCRCHPWHPGGIDPASHKEFH